MMLAASRARSTGSNVTTAIHWVSGAQYDEPSLKPMEDDSPTGQTNRSSFSHGLGFGFDLLHFLAGFITTVAILAAIKLSKSISVFGARPWDSLLDGSEQSVASVSQRFRCGFQV
jgi:hypothetical protein